MTDQKNDGSSPPYEMKHLDSDNVTIIQEDIVQLVEQKRLGMSTMEIEIEDIIDIERLPGDEGDIMILHRKRGNPMRIGPLDSEVAESGSELLKRLMGS